MLEAEAKLCSEYSAPLEACIVIVGYPKSNNDSRKVLRKEALVINRMSLNFRKPSSHAKADI